MSQPADSPTPAPYIPPEEIQRGFRRNFVCLTAQWIIFRIGWIFKTETVLMPAFLNMLGASGTVLGALPLIQRIAMASPKIIVAHIAARMPKLKWAYVSLSLLMAAPWLALSWLCARGAVWTPGSPAARRMIVVFLALYALFWLITGCNQLFGGAIRGKLIPANWRGRLLAVSSAIGQAASIVICLALLSHWLSDGAAPRYDLIFLATGVFMLLAALCILFLREPSTPPSIPRSRLRDFARGSMQLVRHDKNFGRLVLVMCLLLSIRALFPHFTVFGRQRLGLANGDLVWQLVAQNAVGGIAAMVFGPLADRYGNRKILRVLICIAGMTPLLAVGLAYLPGGAGASLYWIVFAFLGFFMVTQQIAGNYLLECVPIQRQAQYLGALATFQVIPLLAAPAMGWLIDAVSFELVFVLGAGLVMLSVKFSGGLIEPRHHDLALDVPKPQDMPE